MEHHVPRILSRAALLSVLVVIGTVFAVPTALAAAPAPVTDLQLSTLDAIVYVEWTPSSTTPSAIVCYALTTPPSTPTDSGATCSDVITQDAWSLGGVDGTAYGVSVFSYDRASSLYGTPASGTITAVDLPPLAPINLGSAAGYNANSIFLFWADNPANRDTKDYLISWAPGFTSPAAPSEMDSSHVASVRSIWLSSLLKTGVVYTFAVRARDVAGHVGPPALLRAATRQDGLYLADNNTVGHALEVTQQFIFESSDVSALLQTDGVMRAVSASTAGSIDIYTHSPAAGWRQPGSTSVFVTSPRHPLIAAAPRIIVAAWSTPTGIYYITKTSTAWSKPVRISASTSETAVGLTSDKAHRVHMLVVRTAGTGRGLYYLTRYAGRTYRSFVAGSGPADIGRLTWDPATDKVVVVDRHRGAKVETVRVKALAPTATTLGTMPTWLSTTNRSVQWRPTAVAANGGRFSLGLQRSTSLGSTTADGPYVVYGTATMHRNPTRVAGTSAVDSNLTVSAPTVSKVVLSWQRHNAGWSPNKLGIWVSSRRYKPATATWSYTAPTHWSNSAYDVPVGAFNDATGHTYLVYVVGMSDVVQ